MKKFICYLLLMLCIVGCAKKQVELTDEQVKYDINQSGLHGDIDIIDKEEKDNKIKLKVNINDESLGYIVEGKITYIIKEDKWVIDKFIADFNKNY